MKHMNNLKNS